MGEYHSSGKHGPKERRARRSLSARYIGERNRNGGQGHRIEAKQETSKNRNSEGWKSNVLNRAAQYVYVHLPPPNLRCFASSARNASVVGNEVNTRAPSMAMAGIVKTPSDTA